jgi:hypothetical protein
MDRKQVVPMRRAVFALVLVLAVFAGACAQQTSPTSAVGQARGGVAAPAPADAAASKDFSGTTPESGIPTLNAVGRDLILTASVTFRSQDPWATADKARAIAAGLGGDLLSLSQMK